MNANTKALIRSLPKEVISDSSEQIQKRSCPQCGGRLLIEFTDGERASVTVSCEIDGFRAHADGRGLAPNWFPELGNKFFTRPSKKAATNADGQSLQGYNMTEALWNEFCLAIKSDDTVPQWIQEQSKLSYATVSELPIIENTRPGEDARPSIEERTVTKGYIDFLSEQISIDVRGDRWKKILQERLEAISPFLNRTLLTAFLYKNPEIATIRIAPGIRKILQIEIDRFNTSKIAL